MRVNRLVQHLLKYNFYIKSIFVLLSSFNPHPHLYASFLGYNCDLVLDYCSTLRCRSLRLLSQTSVHFALRYFGVPFALLTSAYAKSASRRRGVICSLFRYFGTVIVAIKFISNSSATACGKPTELYIISKLQKVTHNVFVPNLHVRRNIQHGRGKIPDIFYVRFYQIISGRLCINPRNGQNRNIHV